VVRVHECAVSQSRLRENVRRGHGVHNLAAGGAAAGFEDVGDFEDVDEDVDVDDEGALEELEYCSGSWVGAHRF
jgi:hypothetical protein